MAKFKSKYSENQDIRDYMEDHGISQRALAVQMGITSSAVCQKLKSELSQKDKEDILRHIDSIMYYRGSDEDDSVMEDNEMDLEVAEPPVESEKNGDVSVSARFQIGDRVKVLFGSLAVGTITDIWHSMAQNLFSYAVRTEDGACRLLSEDQIEPAPIPVSYRFEALIDGNVAVVAMNATQGENEWVCARGHAHIIHDGEVGLAQAVSYAARRMFESLDIKQEKQIYFKGGK